MILLFGGTTEGRELAELLISRGYEVKLSVASEIGFDIGRNSIKGELSIIKGRLDKNEMAELIKRDQVEILIDATHPFAIDVSSNIKAAADVTGLSCLRFQRDKIEVFENDLISKVINFEGAAKRARKTKGKVFLAIGSKHIDQFLKVMDDPRNAVVRVLPDDKSLKRCFEAGVLEKNVIQARGPFSKDENIETLKRFRPSLIVTKNSGKAGGTKEKIEAACELGIPVVLIEPPKSSQYVFTTYGSLLKRVEEGSKLVIGG